MSGGRWRDGPGPEIVAAALTLGYAGIVAKVPSALYVPVNLAAAALLILFASRVGATPADMGLERERLGAGARLGLLSFVPVVLIVAAATVLPSARRLFEGDPVASVGAGRAAYELLIRIPLGTAVAEELIFRGALLGLFLRRHSRWTAATLSSVLFGLWHVLPTVSTLQHDYAGRAIGTGALVRSSAVVGTVLATALAGYVFCWLRYRARSVLAPILAHMFVNGSASIAGRILPGTG